MKKKNLTFTLTFWLLGLTLFAQVPEKSYAKFDFVPGDTVLFEDNFTDESTDEIPSYWVVAKGRVEVARIDGELVMGFLDQSPSAYPRRKDRTNYGSRFTLEFDYLAKSNNKTWENAVNDGNISAGPLVQVQFYNDKEYYDLRDEIGDFSNNLFIGAQGEVYFGAFSGKYTGGKMMESNPNLPEDFCDKWVHVSIAVTERSLKVYINSERVLNAPIESGRAPSFQLLAEGNAAPEAHQVFFKNVRVGAGGLDPYKTLMSTGKIVARGIHFDVAQATIKPESYGTLNTIAKIMKDHPELKIEIGGHTDSDGDAAANEKLSLQRAEAVKAKLVALGIAADRLATKGYGETKPINDNATREGKANNRRVELTKG